MQYTVSVFATVTVSNGNICVIGIEAAVLEATRAARRELYIKAFAALQEARLSRTGGNHNRASPPRSAASTSSAANWWKSLPTIA